MNRRRLAAMIEFRPKMAGWLLLLSVTSSARAAGSGAMALDTPQSTLPAVDNRGQEPAPSPPKPAEPKYRRAVATNTVKPEYTPEALSAGLQGSVVLYLEVSAEGA